MQQQQLAKSAACHEHQLVTSISFSPMIGRGPGLLGGARLQLRDVGGMVYFLFALVLFAALTNITAMDNDGRMPSLPSKDPGAAVEAGSAATGPLALFPWQSSCLIC